MCFERAMQPAPAVKPNLEEKDHLKMACSRLSGEGCPEQVMRIEKVLEKRMLQGDLIVAFLYIKGSYKKDDDRLFTSL